MKPLYDRVAVIGGGACGLATAKALALEPAAFTAIDVYEQRHQVGGIWNYDGNLKSHVHPSIPSTTADCREHFDKDGPMYISPMYKHLETNLVKEIMQYKDVPFPSSLPPFPTHAQVLDYIEKYTQTIPEAVTIRLGSTVVSVTKETDWQVVSSNSDGAVTRSYDAVVIANGHFAVPYIPAIPRLEEWSRKFGTVTHAKYFIEASEYDDQNVLVVGNMSSGTDISIQLSAYAQNVYVSSRDPNNTTKLPHHRATHIGEVSYFDPSTKAICVDGKLIAIDSVIFCTGYLYSVSFLKSYPDLISDGQQIHNLYKQIFYTQDPSISFVALNKNVVPIPFSESQAALIARVYSGRYELPSSAEMHQEYLAELERNGSGKSFHSLPFPRDADYCDDLNQLIKERGLNDVGFVAQSWDAQKRDQRSRTKELKEKRWAELISLANKKYKDNH